MPTIGFIPPNIISSATRYDEVDVIVSTLFHCRVASTPWRNLAMMVLDTLALFLNLRLCV